MENDDEVLTPEEQEEERKRLEYAEMKIAEYERIHGKPMSKTMQAAWKARGTIIVYDKSLYL